VFVDFGGGINAVVLSFAQNDSRQRKIHSLSQSLKQAGQRQQNARHDDCRVDGMIRKYGATVLSRIPTSARESQYSFHNAM
jgi:hypothetical protein